MNLPAEFDSFLIRDAKVEWFARQFAPLMTDVTLIHDDALEQVLRRHQKAAGIYFWVMAVESAKYAIYIGQANPLSRRLIKLY
jgi:hypothetical protein